MQRFNPGEVVITPSALAAFFRNRAEPQEYLDRHLRGDWGDLDAHDQRVNEHALVNGLRLLSAYTLSDGTRIYVITESDRSVTTFLTVDEY